MTTAAATPATLASLHVVVCYATAHSEIMRELWLEQGSTVGDAVAQSGILQEIAALGGPNLENYPTGIFGKKKPPDTLLRDGDRVELYRPLLADPKESRRRRAGNKAASA